MSGKSRAIHPKDATKEEIEEMNRKVRDLVNYLANYDNPEYKQLSKIKNPKAVLVLVQSEQKFEGGLADRVVMSAVGNLNPAVIMTMIRDFLIKAEIEVLLGREIT